MPYTPLFRRNAAASESTSSPFSSSSPNAPIYIAGIVVCVLILVGLASWLGLRYIRKRNKQKMEDERGAAFLTVRGLVKQDNGSEGTFSTGQSGIMAGSAFSKSEYETVVMPDRRIINPVTKNEIIASHRESGNYPKPFSFALNASQSVSSPTDRTSVATSTPRISIISTTSQSVSQRFSVMSTSSSIRSTLSSGQTRKIQQVYDPVLPDELVVSKGERVTVMESFDDGWCLIGRENSIFASTTRTLFGSKKAEDESGFELGVVPAWCFVPPVKGLRADRPVRSSSLGVTVQIGSPAEGRNEVMSWSNF